MMMRVVFLCVLRERVLECAWALRLRRVVRDVADLLHHHTCNFSLKPSDEAELVHTFIKNYE